MMRRGMSWQSCTFLVSLVGALAISGCGAKKDYTPVEELPGKKGRPNTTGQPTESVFGPGGLSLFGGDEDQPQTGGSQIGVNSYLWRATLDTISFMPLASADPFGGVIITDW